jgi:hypothetical protein
MAIDVSHYKKTTYVYSLVSPAGFEPATFGFGDGLGSLAEKP